MNAKKTLVGILGVLVGYILYKEFKDTAAVKAAEEKAKALYSRIKEQL